MFIANLLVILGLVMAVIGGGYFLLEFISGRVTSSTTFRDFNTFQRECFLLAVFGFATFYVGLIALDIIRSI